MKKYVFLSNSNKPGVSQRRNRANIILDSYSLPWVEAALDLGYEVYLGENRDSPEELKCDHDVKFYDSHTYRSLIDIPSNYIAFRNLMRLLRAGNFDVIHCNTPIGGVFGRICGRLNRIPTVIYSVHGFHFYEGAPLLNRTVFKWAEAWLARFTDVMITMNAEDYEAAKKIKLRHGGAVYKVSGVGIDTQRFRDQTVDKTTVRRSLGLPDGAVVVISVGGLVAAKNVLLSIRALAQAANPSMHLLVCGTGPELRHLRATTKDLGVAEQVHFLGFRSDIPQLLQAADIFLFTSRREGLPRSLMEAMAAGLPCVVSRIRGNVDLLTHGEGGFLLALDDVSGFADSLNALAGDEDLRRSMGRQNLDRIRKFDVEVVKAESRAIYDIELGHDQVVT